MPVVDFTGVKIEFEPIPDGWYPGIVEGYEWKDASKSSGEPFVNVKFSLTEEAGEHENRKLFRNYSMQRQSLWAFKRMLVEAGTDPEELAGPLDIEEVMSMVVGAPVMIQVGSHEYEGETRNDVKNVKTADFVPSA